MTFHSMQFGCDTASLLDRPAERLVIKGFRCWVAGYEFGDIDCWETAWDIYLEILGSEQAKPVLSALQYWVRTLRLVSVRKVQCFPHCCNHLNHDERMTLSSISASQCDDPSSMRASLHHLSGLNAGAELDLLTDAANGFSSALTNAGQFLMPVRLDKIEAFATSSSSFNTDRQTKH